MFLLPVKLITQGEKRETSTKTCNETMLRDKLSVFVSRISPSLVLFLPVGYAMLMGPNKAETAVHGCHYLGDKAVHMSDRGLVFELLLLFERSYLCCR